MTDGYMNKLSKIIDDINDLGEDVVNISDKAHPLEKPRLDTTLSTLKDCAKSMQNLL